MRFLILKRVFATVNQLVCSVQYRTVMLTMKLPGIGTTGEKGRYLSEDQKFLIPTRNPT